MVLGCIADDFTAPPTSPAASGEGLHIALKSGNFGTVDFFTKAFLAERKAT